MDLTHLEKSIVENQREVAVPQLGGHHSIARGCLQLERPQVNVRLFTNYLINF